MERPGLLIHVRNRIKLAINNINSFGSLFTMESTRQEAAEVAVNEGPSDDKPKIIGDHIDEFRRVVVRILIGVALFFIICLYANPWVIGHVQGYYINIMESEGLVPRLQTLAPSEGFVSYIRIAAICSLTLSAPWVFFQLWQYASIGLYGWEKRISAVAALFSAILFILGAAFFLCIVGPFSLRFFIVFNDRLLSVTSEFTFQKYMSFITTMMLVFGMAFQTPTIIVFLHKLGIVTLDLLEYSRKYVFLAVFVIAMIVTPPDFVSQVTLAFPLYCLFEVGILLIKLLDKWHPRVTPTQDLAGTEPTDEQNQPKE